ncbi:MAG: phycocyanobilin:ferredoxin oxidoreductase [Cyanobacteria bacterium P01_F01_bin.53]
MFQTRYTPLKKAQHPTISKLANTIKSIWHSQLVLSPYDIPVDLGYVEGTIEGERLTIQNTCYQTSQFRKLHLELAQVGNNLDILHCVMFPHPCFHLPIFGVDIVAAQDRISAAIVDLSPVLHDGASANLSVRTLPTEYVRALANLPTYRFEQPRTLPKWGNIFSDACLFVRPVTSEEESAFLNQAAQYLLLHCQLASEIHKTEDRAVRATILAGQNNYCLQQQKNDKTRRILARAFGARWAQHYLASMLFDCVVENNAESTLENNPAT